MDIKIKELVQLLNSLKSARSFRLKTKDFEIEINDFGFAEAGMRARRQKVSAAEAEIPSEKELNEAQEASLVQQNVEQGEEDMDLMQIEDPSQYERLLVERELEDAPAIN